MAQQTEKQKQQHRTRIDKLTSGAKTDFILKLQKEADNKLQQLEKQRNQIQAEIDNATQKDITINELENDIKLINARSQAADKINSQMKTAFIVMQGDYIQLLKTQIK